MKIFINRRGEGEGVVIGVLLVMGIVVAIALKILGFNFGITNEGTVEYDDCRQVIYLENNSWKKYFHEFTCNMYKTNKGLVMSGECVSIKNDSSLFSSSHTCAAAYVYELKPADVCTDKDFPYLGYDDQCHKLPQ